MTHHVCEQVEHAIAVIVIATAPLVALYFILGRG